MTGLEPTEITVTDAAYYKIMGHRHGTEFMHDGTRYKACGSDGIGQLAFKMKPQGGHVRGYKQVRFVTKGD